MVFRPYALEQNGQRHPTAIGFAIVPTHDGSMVLLYIPDAPCMEYVWNIYLHDWVVFGVNVGKYSSTMECLGMVTLIPSIYPSHVGIYIYTSTMDPSWAMAAGQSDDLQEWVDNPIFWPWRGYSQR